MYRLHLHLTEELKNQLDIKAKIENKTKAEVARQALAEGLKKIHSLNSNSAQALVNIAEIADNLPFVPDDPKDLSINLDHYTWNGEKKNNE